MDQAVILEEATLPPEHCGSEEPWRHSDQDALIDDHLFRRTLDEVYLLIDFVSGRSDRCLRELTVPDVEAPNDPKALPCMLPAEDVIERIAQMRYRPGDCPKTKSRNAAFLLLAKDRLAGLARPACGLTIAYSTMFIGAPGRFIQSVRSLPGMGQRDHSGLERGSRVALAAAAFPGLLAHALWFRTCRNALMWFSILWLLITSFTYWDAALGRSVVQKLDQIWKEHDTLVQAQPELLNPDLCPRYQPNQINQPEPPAPLFGEPQKDWAACAHFWYLQQGRDEARGELTRVFRCPETSWFTGLHPWCWRWLLAGGVEQPPAEEVSWLSAVSILSVVTTYTLPLMFGVLGTLISAFRSIYHKMRYLELAPRDLALTFLGLPLGAVAGVAVGLFFSPSVIPMRGDGVVAGNLTLTASGLAFLAGYGAQAMFRFIDDLLRKIFPSNGLSPQMKIAHRDASPGHS